MQPQRQIGAATLAIITIAGSLIASTGNSIAAIAAGEPVVHAARTLNGTATAHLHLVKADGSRLQEEGPVTGALPGSMRAVVTTGTLFAGNFTIRTKNGTIIGNGTATTHGAGRYQSFSGSITVTGGSGHYTHAHGRTALTGTFDRRTYAIVIQTTGKLSY